MLILHKIIVAPRDSYLITKTLSSSYPVLMVRQERSGRRAAPKAPLRPSPVSNILLIASLKKFDDVEYANSLLHDMAKLVAPLVHEFGFKVGTLCEMYPRNPNLLGLNVNRGQKILIRLRMSLNPRLFYPMSSLIETLLHELTHNVHGPHDQRFYDYLENLKTRFNSYQLGSITSNYRCEELRLGGKAHTLIRQRRLQELNKPIYKAEVRKLGNGSHVTKPGLQRRTPVSAEVLRARVREAAERRLADSKWCLENGNTQDVEPATDELEIISVEQVDVQNEDKENKARDEKDKKEGDNKARNEKDKRDGGNKARNEKDKGEKMAPDRKTTQNYTGYRESLKEVVDLTNEDYGMTNEPEVIVIDACDKGEQNVSESSQSSQNKRVLFSLLPSFDDDTSNAVPDDYYEEEEIHYKTSSSPRAYVAEEALYPRKKFVADLNFDQILRKGSTIEVNQEPLIPPASVDVAKKQIKPRKLSKKATNLRKVRAKQKPNTPAPDPRRKKTVKRISFHELLDRHES